MKRLIILLVSLAICAVGFAGPASAVNKKISLNSVGSKFVHAKFTIKGFASNTGNAHNKTVLLQRKFKSGKWHDVKKVHRVRDGAFFIKGVSAPSVGTARFRAFIYKKRSHILDRTSVLRVKIIKRPVTPPPPKPPVNVNPVATNDTLTTNQDTAATVAVLGNDSDANGDTLTVTAAGAGAHGTTAVNAATTVTYTPAAGYFGADSFTYTISDGHGGVATGTVSVTVVQVVAPFTIKVRVKADANDYIRESNETNNEATADVTIQGVKVTKVVATDGATAGDLPAGIPTTKPADGAGTGGTGTVMLPDLRIKRLNLCGAGDKQRAIDNGGIDCFFIDNSTGKTLLKFAAITINLGQGPLEVNATRTDGATAGTASWNGTGQQREYFDSNADGIWEPNNFKDVLATSSTAGVGDLQFYWEQLASGTDNHGHTHWHMKDFDSYSVDGQAAAVNEKHGFCFEDNTTLTTNAPGTDPYQAYTQTTADDGLTTCGFQQPNTNSIQHGLSIGWGDTYPSSLLDQGIDITAILPTP